MRYLEKHAFCCKLLLVLSLAISHCHYSLAQCSSNVPAISLKTFGAGTPAYSTVTPASFGFSTTYTQEFGGVGAETNDGEFSFVNTVGNYWGTWHGGAKDHTGDPGGYMMLVNASYDPGKFYNDTITGLCTGVEYEFSAWIASVQSSVPSGGTAPDLLVPNVKFEIRNPIGNVLIDDLTTGNIVSEPALRWRRFSLSFIATSDKVVLLLINENGGGNGNDLVLDDIAFKPCLPEHKIGGVTNLCESENLSLALNAITTNFVNPQYKWQKKNAGGVWQDLAGKTTKNLVVNSTVPSDSGWYRAFASGVGNINSPNCRVVDSVHVIIHPTLVPGVIAADQTVCGTKTPALFTQTTAASKGKGTITYQWQFSDDNSTWNNITGATNTTYQSPTISADRWFRRQAKDNGCSTLNSNVVKLTFQTINAPTTTDTSYCAQTGSYTLKATGTSLKWYTSKTGVGTTTAPVNNKTTSGLYKYYVTQTISTCESPFDSVQIEVFSKPNITLGDIDICEGTSTSLTPTINATGTVTYLWSPATGLNSTTAASVTASPTTTTDYTVIATDSKQCKDTVTAKVTVNPTLVPGVIAADQTVCGTLTPALFTQTTAASKGKGTTTYQWQFSNDNSTWNNITGATNTTYQSPTISADRWFRRQDKDNGCSTLYSNVVKLTFQTINAPTTTDTSYCAQTGTYTLKATGTSLKWYTSKTGVGASVAPLNNKATAGIFTYYVTQTINTCESPFDSVQIAVFQKPVITIIDVEICEGADTTLTSTVTNATGIINYLWSTTGGGLTNNTTSTLVVKPTTTTDYNLLVTDTEGCIANKLAKVTVNPKPTLVSSDAEFCAGQNTTLTVSGADSYVWSPSIGLSNTTGASVTANPLNTTSYSVEGTSAKGCKSSKTVNVSVNPKPLMADVTEQICEGLKATLTVQATNTTGTVSYAWSPAVGLNGLTGSSVEANPTVNTTYTVEVIDQKNCKDTATATVTVLPKPILTSNDVAFCEGLSSMASVFASNTAGTVTYLWSPATGLNSITTASVTANPTTTTDYTVIATDGNNCKDTVITRVTVHSKPVVTIIGGDVCNGVPLQLLATVLKSTGNITYLWSPNTALSSTSTATVTAMPTISTVYTLEVEDGNGCKDTTTTTVGVTQNPVANILQGDTILCPGETVQLDALNDATQNYAVEWLYGTNPTALLPIQNGFTATVQKEGYYGIKVTNYGFCPQYTTPIFVEVENLSVKAKAEYSEVYFDEAIQLFAEGSSNIVQYKWTSPFQSYNQKEVKLFNAEPAWYEVEGQGKKCRVTDKVFVNVLPPIIIPNGFSPNGDAMNEGWFIKGLSVFKEAGVTVYNRWGNVVYQSDGYEVPWDGKNQSGEFLPVATYYYVIEVNDRRNQEFKGSVTVLK